MTTILPLSLHEFLDRQSTIFSVHYPSFVLKSLPDINTKEDGVAAYLSLLAKLDSIAGQVERAKIREGDSAFIQTDGWLARTHDALTKTMVIVGILNAWLTFCGCTDHKCSDIEKYQVSRERLVSCMTKETEKEMVEIVAERILLLLSKERASRASQIGFVAEKILRLLSKERSARMSQSAHTEFDLRRVVQSLRSFEYPGLEWASQKTEEDLREELEEGVSKSRNEAKTWYEKNITKIRNYLQNGAGAAD